LFDGSVMRSRPRPRWRPANRAAIISVELEPLIPIGKFLDASASPQIPIVIIVSLVGRSSDRESSSVLRSLALCLPISSCGIGPV
jgi:hypothetical protein